MEENGEKGKHAHTHNMPPIFQWILSLAYCELEFDTPIGSLGSVFGKQFTF